jgi:hypothetical protein
VGGTAGADGRACPPGSVSHSGLDTVTLSTKQTVVFSWGIAGISRLGAPRAFTENIDSRGSETCWNAASVAGAGLGGRRRRSAHIVQRGCP